MNVCMRETKTGRCVFASLYLFVPVHSPKRVFTLWGHLHVQVTVLQDEPTDSSAQTEFPCKLFPPFVWGDEENGLISASDCSNFISISKWASSCVSFCTISKSFCYCFIFLLLFTKMAETFSHPLDFTFAQSLIVQEQWYFVFIFWRSADIFDSPRWIFTILMVFNSNGVYMSIILVVDTHPRRGAKYLHLLKLNIWESSRCTSPPWCHTMGGWVM